MTSQTELQVTTIHILSNISRSKSNQTVNSSWLIEYNMRNTFLEKSYTEFGAEACSRPIHKKSNLTISLNQQSGML